MIAYFDASVLAKRYVREAGSAEVIHVFARTRAGQRGILAVGLGEVVSVMTRKRNRGDLSVAAYAVAYVQFRAEVLESVAVRKVEADLATVERSLPLIDAHSLNATDALILRTALDLKAAGDPTVLVSSDQRLTRAAAAEGLPVYDPERQPSADFDRVWPPLARNGTG